MMTKAITVLWFLRMIPNGTIGVKQYIHFRLFQRYKIEIIIVNLLYVNYTVGRQMDIPINTDAVTEKS